MALSILIDVLHISLWLIDGILTSTTTLGQNECGSNCNEGVLYTLKIFKTGVSPFNAV